MSEKLENVLIVFIGIVVVIIGAALSYGIMGYFVSNAVNKADYFQTMRHASDKTEFDYLLSTNAGRTGVDNAVVKAIKPVSIDGLLKKYTYVSRNKEEYTMHTETYTTTDSKGNSTTHTRTYWTWDYVGGEHNQSDSVTINGVKTPLDRLDIDEKPIYLNSKNADLKEIKETGLFGIKIKKTPKLSASGRYLYIDSDTRYYFDGVPEKYKTTLFAKLGNKQLLPLEGDTQINQYDSSVDEVKKYKNETADKMQSLQIGVPIVIALILAGVYVFVIAYMKDRMMI